MRTWAFAVSLLLFISAGAAYAVVPQSTLPTGQAFHYVCTVTGEAGIGVTNCYARIIGPEPDGSIYLETGLSFDSLTCFNQGSPWNPVVTWTFSPGNQTTGPAPGAASEHYPAAAVPGLQGTGITVAFTVSVPSYGTASGNMKVTLATGTNSFTNTFQQYPSCPTTTTTSAVQTSTSTSVASTTTAQTSTTTTQSLSVNNPPPSQGNNNVIASGVLVVVALVFLGVGFTGRRTK